jgi:hypothetical protein
MSVEQHAEAAFEEIADLDELDRSEPEVISIIDKHICAAIDEATAPLKARVESLEGLGPLIEDAIAWGIKFGDANEAEEQAVNAELVKMQQKITAILTGGAP